MQKFFIQTHMKATVLLGAGIFVLTGCGAESGSGDSGEESGGSTETRSIEHEMGTTEVEGDPQRVVTLFQGATDTAVALDIEPVGAVESWVEQPSYQYLRDDLENTEIVGDELQPNLEEIEQLDPDLIIGAASRHEEVYGQLEQIAPTVMIDPLYDFKNTMEVMGEATNQSEQAETLLNDWDTRVQDFKNQAETELENWPSTASILNIRSDQVRMYVGGFPGEILNEAGFERTDVQKDIINSGEIYGEYTNTESIPELDADKFFVFMQGNQEEAELQETSSTWTNHPLWNDLQAVNDEEVYMVDEITWNLGGGYIAANEMLDQLYESLELEQ